MKSIALLAVLAGTASAFGQAFNETENNNSRTQADAQGIVTLSSSPNGVSTWAGVTGTTTGTNSTDGSGASYDWFHLRTAAAAPGIYLNQMVITTTGTAGHSGAIMGLTQSSGVIGTSSTALQTNITSPARLNQWYSFGASADLYYRVGGSSSTTAPYTATYTSTPVTPIAGPASLASGNITISCAGTAIDTDMWIYDSNFNAIAGYGDDDLVGAVAGFSGLTRSFAAGTYYIAISRYNLANNQASPLDDGYTSGSVTDFPGVVLGTSSTTTAAPFSLSFLDSSGGAAVVAPVTISGAFNVQFIQFTVVPTPGAAAMLGIGGLAALRRRR